MIEFRRSTSSEEIMIKHSANAWSSQGFMKCEYYPNIDSLELRDRAAT